MHHDKAQFLLGDPSRVILHLDPAEYTVAMPAARASSFVRPGFSTKR